jgi:arylsulfatase A-like enzyme
MNILWIIADQLQADCLGFMGNPIIQTPHLDELAAQSFVFERAYVQTPVCMGSRASMMTGRYPATCGAKGMGILPPQEITIAETLKRQQYRTGMFGKLHLTPQQYTRQQLGTDIPISDWRVFKDAARLPDIVDDPCKHNYGFDELIDCDDSNRGVYQQWLKEQTGYDEKYRDGVELTAAGNRPEPMFPGAGCNDVFVSPVPSNLHHSSFISSEAEQFIRRRKDAGSWFAWCSFIHPHHPFEAPQDQIDRYPLADIPLPDKAKGEPCPDDFPSSVNNVIGGFSALPQKAQRTLIQHYYASISLIDDNVGKLISALKETGQWDNTIIIFASDHGEFAGERGLMKKPSFHYEELIRVPLSIRVPGQEVNAQKLDGLVEMVDIYPTLMGLLEMEIHPGVQGRDWSDALLHGGKIGREEIHCESFGPFTENHSGGYGKVQTLRTEKWKLSIYPDDDQEHGLFFDMEKDPLETTNLYHDPQYQKQREEMLWRLLRRKFQETDPLPIRLSQW